ncbi:MAG: GAF domain-containing sensor histidine kinase [Acidimicrobiia bacterium]
MPPVPDVSPAPAPGAASAALSAVSAAMVGLAGEPTLGPVLLRLVHAAKDLVGARYAALGIPDGEGGFDAFITAGMSDELIDAIGPLPRTHGLLAAMLTDPDPYRTEDIRADPRFEWWPPAHPRMRSFLGVPLVFKGDIVGAFYLTDKEGGFVPDDEDLVRVLAAHAAVVVEHARLYEASREASISEERDRLARDLHDALTQRLFSLNLILEAASTRMAADPESARASLGQARELVDAALGELRSLIFELRPLDLETDGLFKAVAKHTELVSRAHGLEMTVVTTGHEDKVASGVQRHLFRVVQEALSNVVRHASAGSARVEIHVAAAGDRYRSAMAAPDSVRVVVSDDGVGFDPDARAIAARRLGLTSMRERVESLGGGFEIVSAPGEGTTVAAEVPRG